MNQLPAPLRRCALCEDSKPAAEFGQSYCRLCQAALDRWYRETGRSAEDFRHSRGPELAASARVAARQAACAGVVARNETEAYLFLRKVFAAGGFSALRQLWTRASHRIARENREDIGREGWIA